LLPPYERGHASATSVAPIREETRRVRIGAPVAAEDRADSERREAPPGEAREIALPAAPVIRSELAGCACIACEESAAHLIADFEMSGADAGTWPCEEPSRLRREALHGRLQHARHEAAPPGVRRGHRGAITYGEEHRQAVGHLHSADRTNTSCDRGIRGDTFDGPAHVQIENLDAVYLFHPGRLLRQVQLGAYASSVLHNRGCLITHVCAEVQRREGPRAHTARSKRERRVHVGGYRPLGREDLNALRSRGVTHRSA